MANIFTPSIEGDGINFTFFQHLWHKNRNEEREQHKVDQNTNRQNKSQLNPIRLPDTVIFQLGQPLHWYFTSERGRQTIILRKRKQNVNVEKIEAEFVRKAKAANKGCSCENDVIAYFIASSDCTLRKRKGTEQEENNVRVDDTLDDNDFIRCDFKQGDQTNSQDSVCDIEYFNKERLHEFLFKTRKNQSGILQRFVEPSGGGKHNSQIRAICTPKLCVLERRKTKQELHDSRFGLYERAVTFEGPEVHSTSLPIRGETLPGRLRALCDTVLNHLSDATKSVKTSTKRDVRMVLNLKVDSKDRIWLLYSSSIRTVLSSKSFPSVQSTELQDKANFAHNPLNIQDIIKLSPNIKLSQKANHDPTVDISNTVDYLFCPSCNLVQLEEHFHPVPYKTIATHFEQVMMKSNNQWPPPKDIVMSAGGVGFGKVIRGDIGTSVNDIEEEDLVIPPVIRYLHKRLKAEGYRRYRSDPLFLHKHCKLCEGCFLSYANLVNTSFQIKLPIKLDTELNKLGFDRKIHKKGSSLPGDEKVRPRQRIDMSEKHVNSFSSEILMPMPSFPPAILEPPIIKEIENIDELMPLPYETIASTSQPLMHLLKMHQALEKSKIRSNQTKPKKVVLNPYEVPLKFVSVSNTHKKKNKDISCESQLRTKNSSASDDIEQLSKGLAENEVQLSLLSNTLAELVTQDKI